MRASGWLVELGSNPPSWWTGRMKGDRQWTSHAADAMRFARFEDAEGARCHLITGDVWRGCKSTEHIWDDFSEVSASPVLEEARPQTEMQEDDALARGSGQGASPLGTAANTRQAGRLSENEEDAR